MGLFRSYKDEGHLAKTRKEQFGYILRNNISTLFFSNIISFLFFIPFIVDITISLIVYKNMLMNDQVTPNSLFSVFLICGLVAIPCMFILEVGVVGLYSVIKGLVFDSTARRRDFFKGIKHNFKSSLFVNLILSIVVGLLIINIGVNFYIVISDVLKIIIMIINILLLFTLLIGKGFTNFEVVVFNNTTYAYLRNGIYLFYKRLPLSLLILFLLIIPVASILFIPIQYVFIPLGILATFYISLSALGIFLISIHTYEKIFEQSQIKEIYHKGLENINL